MFDRFNREINYLRISVTDRCNLRCSYCMPGEVYPLFKEDNILTFEEIEEFARNAVSRGIRKVRLTGGEPLLRKDITLLVSKLSKINGIEELSMTTNGILLNKYAFDLKKSGLNRVNISLDTVNHKNYNKITGNGDLNDVLTGIKSAKKAELTPIKINCVLNGQSENEIKMLKDFCTKEDLSLRFINQMDLKTGKFSKVNGGDGGNCQKCNRIRLLSNGDVKPCLFDNLTFNIRNLGIQKTINLAIDYKPKSGTYNKTEAFNRIGG